MDFRIPNVYTLGQVQLNTQPLVQLQGQLLAKRKAQEDALDKYFSDFAGKLTTTGMRQQDIPGFLKRKDELMKEGIARKDEIAKGGLAKQEFSSKFDNLFGDIERSKQAAKLQYDLAQAKQKGDLNEDDFPTLDAISRSIYEDAHYKDPVTKATYSFADFSPAVELPDVSKINQYYNAIAQGIPTVREYEKDAQGKILAKQAGPGSSKMVQSFIEKYGKDQLINIADRASNFATVDKSFRKLYTGILNDAAKATEAQLPLDPRFVELKKVYDEYFPGDIMDRPEEVAKADAILQFRKFGKAGTDTYTDTRLRARAPRAGGGGGAAGGVGVIDLSEYPEISGKGRDITDLMQGVTVFQAPDGTKLSASKVYYDPDTKQINYETLVGRDESGKIVKGAPKALSLNTFLQNIKTLNPGTDFKFVETLGAARVPGKVKPKGDKKGADIL